MGGSKSSAKGEVYNNTMLPQETRKIWNKQPNPTLKQLQKEQNNPKFSRRKEIIRIRSEIKEKEMK